MIALSRAAGRDRCPTCRKAVARKQPFFPFCSERCRLVDLGKWLGEEYRVPLKAGPEPESDSDEDTED
ncbi:MAG: DNA gyrase inhibitor YacG [Acidobacteria bacterium]|nr:DNA gyrase inhibitor YacG [Acidobacteriota bacterium]